MSSCYNKIIGLQTLFLYMSADRIRTDHNMDDTGAVVDAWCAAARDVYLSIDCLVSDVIVYSLPHPFSESNEQYVHIATLQQAALEAARHSGADYFFVRTLLTPHTQSTIIHCFCPLYRQTMNADNFLTNPRTLQLLMEQDR